MDFSKYTNLITGFLELDDYQQKYNTQLLHGFKVFYCHLQNKKQLRCALYYEIDQVIPAETIGDGIAYNLIMLDNLNRALKSRLEFRRIIYRKVLGDL